MPEALDDEAWRSAEIKVIADDMPQSFEVRVNEALRNGWKKESRATVAQAQSGDYQGWGYTIVLFKSSKP